MQSSSPPSVPADHNNTYDDFIDYFNFPGPTSDADHHDSVGMMRRRRRRRGDDEVSDEMMTKRAKAGDEAVVDCSGGTGVCGDDVDSVLNDEGGFGFDLNEPVDLLGRVGESFRCFLDDDVGEIGLSADEFMSKGKEVLCIGFDGGEDEERFGENAMKLDLGRDQNLWMLDVGMLGEGSSRSSQRRYTREEKGKGIVDGNWLSIAVENHRMAHSERDENDVPGGGDRDTGNTVEQLEDLGFVNENFEEYCFLPDVKVIDLGEQEEFVDQEAIAASIFSPHLNLEPPLVLDEIPPPVENIENTALFKARRRANMRRGERKWNKKIARDYVNRVSHPLQQSAADSSNYEIQEITGPFSSAMQKLIDHKQGKHWLGTQQKPFSIDWTPSRRQGSKLMTANIPSLIDLSINVLASNAESIVSLKPVPDALKHRISQAACDRRKMDGRFLAMFVGDSPTEVCVKDCSWMIEEQFIHIFRSLNTKSLMVLQLDLCGQALTEYTLGTTLAQSKNGLPALANLSLKSACRLTDIGLASIIESAPSLQSINLSQCSLMTSCGISKLADSLGSKLKELYIDDCSNIDALEMLPALAKLERLEVLSVSGIHTVSDEFVSQFIFSCRSKLKEISLAYCQKLTDSSLKAISKACPDLHALDISNLDQLTDASVEYIANGCRSIQRLKCCRNSFSDEAIASFVEISGQSLKELSLNHISQVGSYSALSLAKHSRSLLNLDLSWCRKLTDAAVGLVVDSCLSLRLLKLFGCTQITEVFLNGHSNPRVEIIGLNNMSVLKQLSAVDTHPGPLRYSSLIT